MGKKYIIELEDKPFHKGNGDFLYRVKGFNSLVFDMTGVGKLTPYTEPDMEKIREEAYRQGYDTGYGTKVKKFYEQGLADAWEAARKIANMPYGEEEKVFGSGGWAFIEKHTASEAIEKIRQYEQEQKQEEEQIQIGDEVILDGRKYVVLVVDEDGIPEKLLEPDGYTLTLTTDVKLPKTGRHYPQIAAVLAKMKEGS